MIAPPALELRGVTVELGGAPVLRGVELQLAAREHVLLIGRSGSGKSTLLRTAAGLLAPSAGEVHLGGRLASRAGRVLLPPERRGIGYLFQGGALWPHLDVTATLQFVLRAGGVPRAERAARIAELLALVGLEGFEHRRPESLSGGEAQRLGLARALAARPPLVLLDEPLGPLDAELRRALLERLQALQERLGFAALHVTHDPRESSDLAHRVLELHDGRLREARSMAPGPHRP